ncbi:hypothetical protein ACLOJK_017211 [Asimina triloba]
MEFPSFISRINVLVLLLALCSPCESIQSPLDLGPLSLLQTTTAAYVDFGRLNFNSPSAVLRPESPEEICQLLRFVSAPSSSGELTVAARGAGHSINGQAQARNGIVVEMESLPPAIEIHRKADGEAGFSHADVSGGALWVELLKESLKHGLAPRSWTDYLYLTIGGTLSNAGISGQTFKYGPQIRIGEHVTCSPTQSSDLFYSVLGGLGQFGIITSARIILQEAPKKVKWVRAFYDDFGIFTKDQELLISMADVVDYVEGFIVLNEGSLLGSSIAFPTPIGFTTQLHSGASRFYYYIEFAVYYHSEGDFNADHVVEQITKQLSFMPSQIYSSDVSYFDFLNRVRMEELSLRSHGLWDVTHPWMNMIVPKSGILQFKDLLLDNISPSSFVGPVIIYPILRHKWNSNMSAVLPEPDGDVVYVIGVLRSANPSTCSAECLERILDQNRRIVETATSPRIGGKQYLPHYVHKRPWEQHFGEQWQRFLARKAEYDPLHVLAPGQGIFKRKKKPTSSPKFP